MNKIVYLLLFLLAIGSVSAWDYGYNPFNLSCLQLQQIAFEDTGFVPIDCLDGGVVYVKGDFSYGHHSGSSNNDVNGVPEFSSITLIVCVCAVIAGLFIVRKKGGMRG